MSEKKLVHIDKKVLHPGEQFKFDAFDNKPQKGIIGRPKIYNFKGELLAEEENLVVLTGREFLAQKLLTQSVDSNFDLTKYDIRYFGIGNGGTSNGDTPSTVGPFDTDLDLNSPVKFTSTGGDINTSTNDYKYISNGYLKKIVSDGEMKIIQEEHTVNTESGNVTIQKYTSIKFTLKIQMEEPAVKPFKFNEAGLYAVEYDSNGTPTSNKILFARFTTLDKYLDSNDGIIIEWHVLV